MRPIFAFFEGCLTIRIIYRKIGFHRRVERFVCGMCRFGRVPRPGRNAGRVAAGPRFWGCNRRGYGRPRRPCPDRARVSTGGGGGAPIPAPAQGQTLFNFLFFLKKLIHRHLRKAARRAPRVILEEFSRNCSKKELGVVLVCKKNKFTYIKTTCLHTKKHTYLCSYTIGIYVCM